MNVLRIVSKTKEKDLLSDMHTGVFITMHQNVDAVVCDACRSSFSACSCFFHVKHISLPFCSLYLHNNGNWYISVVAVRVRCMCALCKPVHRLWFSTHMLRTGLSGEILWITTRRTVNFISLLFFASNYLRSIETLSNYLLWNCIFLLNHLINLKFLNMKSKLYPFFSRW